MRLAMAMRELDYERVLALPHGKLMMWRAFDMLQPFGFPHEDDRHALLVAAASQGAVRMESARYRPPFRTRRGLTPDEIRTRMGG